MRSYTANRNRFVCQFLIVSAVSCLLVCGCSGESRFQQTFPPDFISKAQSNFKVDMTGWDVSVGQRIPPRARLAFYCQAGVAKEVGDFCEQKLVKSLNARGFEIDPNEQAELTVCIVKASEIKKPVRSAKVRMAVKLSTNEGSDPVALGIVDGIVARPDLSSGVWMPKSAYRRATQYAVAKLVDQLGNMPKSTSSLQ
jgi:uncharacterized lipoprotein YajG